MESKLERRWRGRYAALPLGDSRRISQEGCAAEPSQISQVHNFRSISKG